MELTGCRFWQFLRLHLTLITVQCEERAWNWNMYTRKYVWAELFLFTKTTEYWLQSQLYAFKLGILFRKKKSELECMYKCFHWKIYVLEIDLWENRTLLQTAFQYYITKIGWNNRKRWLQWHQWEKWIQIVQKEYSTMILGTG